MAVTCSACGSEDLELVEVLEDERRRVRCTSCGHDWLRGEAKRIYKTTRTFDDLRSRFPSPGDVAPDTMRRAAVLKEKFLGAHASGDPRAIAFREKYRRLFTEGSATPQDLKYFANSNLAGNPGNMSVFNDAWNDMGAAEASVRVKEAIDYLLHGPEGSFLEDRLTNLIVGHHGLGMTGFREALLTKVLCMVEPDRFLPINKYTGQSGKREIAKWVYDLDLPRPESTSWTIGRLIIWSNDLLLTLAGDGFVDTEHVAGFLWGAKEVMRRGT